MEIVRLQGNYVFCGEQCNLSGHQPPMSIVNNNATIIILLQFVNWFIQGKYNYIPDTNHVPRAYNFAGILRLQFDSCNVISHEKFVIFKIIASRSTCAEVYLL